MPERGRPDTVVVKIGGSRLRTVEQLAALAGYVGLLHERRAQVVLVHGGGPEIAELHGRLDVPFTKHRGLRVTSAESMPLVCMVLCGVVNKRVVARLVAAGLPALGLSGVDMGLLRSSFLNHELLGRVGGPPRVQADRLQALLSQGLIPVIAPVCLGVDDAPVNVNADTAAHALAMALQATSLEFISDVPGVLLEGDVVAGRLSPADAQRLLTSSAIVGGMIPKLQAALAAVGAGVGRVRIGDLEAMNQNTATEIVA